MKTLSGKQYTARELAERFGCDTDTITNHANALFGKGAGRGKTRYFDEAQTTAILEKIKNPATAGRQATSATVSEAVETELSTAFQLAMLYKQAAALERNLRIKAENRVKETEAAYGREVLDHKATKALLTERETGLGTYQRIAEAAGLVMSDRDDLGAPYRRYAR
jgi:hypothetical protein